MFRLVSLSRKTLGVALITILVSFILIGFYSGSLDSFLLQAEDDESFVLDYSTYFGGTGGDDGYKIILDDDNNILVAGSTESPSLPSLDQSMVSNPSPGKRSGFVTKFSSNGEIIFSTFIGGSDHDTIRGLAVIRNGNIVIAGDTMSADFPITDNALDITLNGTQKGYYDTDFCCSDGFLSIISNDGEDVLYSSYLGGEGVEGHLTLQLDSKDNIVISGFTTSNDLNVTSNALQNEYKGKEDLFISIFNPLGNELLYSSYFGGSGNDFVFGNFLKLDLDDNIYLSGSTNSIDMTTTPTSIASSLIGKTDAFLVKFGAMGAFLDYATYLGGSGDDIGFSVAVDMSGKVFVTGSTLSIDLPVTDTAYQSEFSGGGCWQTVVVPLCGDGYLLKLSQSGEISYASYLGGTSYDIPFLIHVDKSQNIIVAGLTSSSDFPTESGYQLENRGGIDIFVSIFSGLDFTLIQSTYLGGVSAEFVNDIYSNQKGEYYLTGWTASFDYPTTDDGIYTTQIGGGMDIVISKFVISNG